MTDSADWTSVEYEPGQDPFWDRLRTKDESWEAIEGVLPDIRIYVTWRERPDGRLVVSGVCVRGNVVTAEVLRAVPIRRLEEGANEVRAGVAAWWTKELPPLTSPRENKLDPDKFSELVAMHYKNWAAISTKPAKEIADRANVPVATVHRWIRDARLRGHLPAAVRGKSG